MRHFRNKLTEKKALDTKEKDKKNVETGLNELHQRNKFARKSIGGQGDQRKKYSEQSE